MHIIFSVTGGEGGSRLTQMLVAGGNMRNVGGEGGSDWGGGGV